MTGGSSDLGRAVVRQLAVDGFHVIIHSYHGLADAQQLATSVEMSGGSAQAISFNLANPAATAAALGMLLAKGPVHAFVHHALTQMNTSFSKMTMLQWRYVIDTNLNGFFEISKLLAPAMTESGWGRIMAVLAPEEVTVRADCQVNDCAARGGLQGTVRALARELGGCGVTANAVAPGIIASNITDQGHDAVTIREMVPSQRAGRPEEVADLVSFLISDRAAYINGQMIAVDGGLH